MAEEFRVSFGTIPQKWTPGVRVGFIVSPKDAEGKGYGTPYFDKDGHIIQPGTADGPSNHRLIGINHQSEKWKMYRSENFQVAGNIDWVGLEKTSRSGAVMTERFVLSCNGPNSRYWNLGQAFTYGAESNHNYVYGAGKIAGVAPLPVLGCCFQDGFRIVAETGLKRTVKWLIAACKDGEGDVVYAREFVSYVKEANLGQEGLLEGMKKLASTQNPTGWILIGAYPKQGEASVLIQVPDTPWFFDVVGKEGRCLRRASKTFDDGQGDSKTETIFVQYTVKVIADLGSGELKASFDSAGVTDTGFTWTEQSTKTHPTWTNPVPDIYGLTHSWQEDWLIQSVNYTGKMLIATDYDYVNKVWLKAFYEENSYRYEAQYWSEGTDPDPYLDINLINRTNAHSYGGFMPWETPPNVISQGNHEETEWIGDTSRTYLSVGQTESEIDYKMVIGYGQHGTHSMASGQPFDPNDPYLYFWDSYDVWLHFADLRYSLFSGYVRYDSMIFGNPVEFRVETLEWGGQDEMEIFKDSPDSVKFMRNSAAPVYYSGTFMDYGRTTMKTWPQTYATTVNVTDWNGTWSTTNDDGSKFDPAMPDFFLPPSISGAENKAWRRRGFKELVEHSSRNYRQGYFLGTHDDSRLLAMTYTDELTHETVFKNNLWPYDETIEKVVGYGKEFYPMGVM